MKPIKLEIFLDDRTRSGMQSAERNITGLETQMQEVINCLLYTSCRGAWPPPSVCSCLLPYLLTA